MLKKVLIANRGEIAARIVRTARRMGLGTVAVYSDADAGALHTRLADEAVHLGPAPSTESYLRIDRVIAAARATGADCIHPGYGFLAENAELSDACAAAGIKFIGPSGAAMRALGGKAAAKILARKAGVPVVPGYEGEAQDARSLAREAARIGFPVMIKAVAGGGGRGMRLVERAEDLGPQLESAQREAQSSFGDDRVLIEKVVVAPRHIEVQVFGDSHGQAVHLFERDCTLQRRNQKVIEEAPAPGMSEGLRAKMCEAAVTLARSVGYEGAGTVEFLVEGGALSPSAPWYFIEMNTRLQVEHPVTEEITGLDLVEWQIRIAAGERLPLAQKSIAMKGHAIEVRLNAEDPSRGFLPSIGTIHEFDPPRSAVRVETGVGSGSTISPYYDSMVAKLITHGANRAEAIDRMIAALNGTAVIGVRTNARFLRALLQDAGVQAARMDTGLIARQIDGLTARAADPLALSVGVEALLGQIRADAEQASGLDGDHRRRWSAWSRSDAFQLGGGRSFEVPVLVDDTERKVRLEWQGGWLKVDGHMAGPSAATAPQGGAPIRARAAGDRVYLLDDLHLSELRLLEHDVDALDEGVAGGAVKAPINGKVAKVFVAAGAKVAKGDRIAIVEAMKMEHVLAAGIAGTVAELKAAEGAQVTTGQVIARIEEG